MHPLVSYVIKRLCIAFVAIFIGITITFIISRMLPFNAAETFINQLLSMGTTLRGEDIELLRKQLIALYGLDKPIWQQYIDFVKGYLTGNLGPSFAFGLRPVSEIIANALPWSITLLMTVSIINWLIGIFIGAWAATTKYRRVSAALEHLALIIIPIPYAVLGLAFLIFYALVLRLPLTMYGTTTSPGLSLGFILTMFQRALLPAAALVMFGWFGNFIGMKNLALRFKFEDFIMYKYLQGAPDSVIRFSVLRNAIIPQYTTLVLGLSRVFVGSMLVEYLFNYPGIGLILRYAITSGDFNLMLAIISMTVVATIIGTVILDFTYPLIDPRIRYPGAG